MPLHSRMLVGFVVGLISGLLVHWLAPGAPWVEWLMSYVTQPARQIFLRLLTSNGCNEGRRGALPIAVSAYVGGR